jgi:hypothetical protein
VACGSGEVEHDEKVAWLATHGRGRRSGQTPRAGLRWLHAKRAGAAHWSQFGWMGRLGRVASGLNRHQAKKL